MGLEESKLRRNVRGVLNYAQLLLSVVAVIWYPFWIAGGYLSDCWIGPVDWLWDLCIPVYVPVTVAVFGSLIGGIWYTIRKKKRTGSWW